MATSFDCDGRNLEMTQNENSIQRGDGAGREINARSRFIFWGADVSTGIAQFRTGSAIQRQSPGAVMPSLRSCYFSFSLSGQNENPKTKQTTAADSTQIFTSISISLKKPLKQLPIMTYLKISKNRFEIDFFLSRWNNAICQLYHSLTESKGGQVSSWLHLLSGNGVWTGMEEFRIGFKT